MGTGRAVHFNPFVVFCVLFYFDFGLVSIVEKVQLLVGESYPLQKL